MNLGIRSCRRVNTNDDPGRWVVDWDALSQGIRNNTVLNQLKISGSILGENVCDVFSNALSQNTTLKSLHLENCLIDDSGATQIAKHLVRNNRILEERNLNNNLISNDGVVVAFTEALKENDVINFFQLNNPVSDFTIGERGSTALLNIMLGINTTLLWIALNKTVMDGFDTRSTYYLRLKMK